MSSAEYTFLQIWLAKGTIAAISRDLVGRWSEVLSETVGNYQQ